MHRATSLQSTTKPTDNGASRSPMTCQICRFLPHRPPRGCSPISSCKSQPCNTSKKEKISINCGSEWIHSSCYPGISHPSHSPRSHTLLTRDQNLISRKSDSWPPQETRGPDRDPIEEPPGQIISTAFGHFHCCGRW